MLSQREHQNDKMFIEKYVYGKDEHGHTTAGGFPMKEYLKHYDGASDIGMKRLENLSVPSGLVYIRDPIVATGGDNVQSGGRKKNEVRIIDDNIFDILLGSVCHTRVMRKFSFYPLSGGGEPANPRTSVGKRSVQNKTKKIRIES